MMDINDAKAVIKALQEKPFICSEDFIQTDNGYVIKKMTEKRSNADKIRSMSIQEMATDLVNIFEELFEDGVPSPEWMEMWLQSEAE